MSVRKKRRTIPRQPRMITTPTMFGFRTIKQKFWGILNADAQAFELNVNGGLLLFPNKKLAKDWLYVEDQIVVPVQTEAFIKSP